MNTRFRRSAIPALVLAALLASCGQDGESDEPGAVEVSTTLNGIEVSTWMYQIQWLDTRTAIDELDDTDYDMLVVEPGFNLVEDRYDVDYLISNLKQKPNGDERVLLAYIDIGQAEDYRTYWEGDWVAPTSTEIGSPDFLLTIDPDGWTGNYPVAYWHPDWKDIWLGSGGIIEQIANFGFDGVYLDWVEGYDDAKVREIAGVQSVSTENEMMQFLQEIRALGRALDSEFLVVPQNAPYLLDADPTLYVSLIDALATEDTWFYGEGDVLWEDTNAGDLAGGDRHDGDYSTVNRIAQSKKYLALGISVFSVDYCISEENARRTYVTASENGFIPLVTRVPLTNITETPPAF